MSKVKNTLLTALAVAVPVAAFSLIPRSDIVKGTYEGYHVEAIQEGSGRRIIMYPGLETKGTDRAARLIGVDYLNGTDFESIEFLYCPLDSNLRNFGTPEHLQKAWFSVRGN